MSESGEDQRILAAIECAANPTRHKILEILSETPGLGTKALAEKMGVTRQHLAYHIGELRKANLIKDMQAGTIVVYNISQLGRTALQRIHLTPPPEKPPAQEVPPPIPPPPQKVNKPADRRGVPHMRFLSLVPALASSLIIFFYSAYRAGIDNRPNYIWGGLMVAVVAFLLFAYLSKKILNWLQVWA